MKGIFYGIGVGPGDPELITLRAIRTIRETDVIAVPHTGNGRTVALDIARNYIRDDSEILELDMPMLKDRSAALEAYDKAAAIISEKLANSQNVAFLTLGDVSLYSTFSDLQSRVEEKGYEVRLVPGIPAVCAVAAALKQPLAEGRQALCIIPAIADDGNEQVINSLNMGQNVAVMKAGSQIVDLKNTLEEHSYLENAAMIERCGLPGERIIRNFNDINESSGYFSTVLVKCNREK